jgi:hypothetical protein
MEALLLLWLALGASGSWVAAQKGRSPGEGFALGCLLGPIGVLVEAMLPVGLESSEFAPRKTQKDSHEEAARLRRNAELQAEYFRDVATLIQEEKKRLKKERMWSDELLRLERHNLRQAREEARARERERSQHQRASQREPRQHQAEGLSKSDRVLLGIVVGIIAVFVLLCIVLIFRLR